MATKLVTRRHQTLINLFQTRLHRMGNAMSTHSPPFTRSQSLLQSRRYSETSQETKIDPSSASSNARSVSSSLNESELAKFSAIAETWWDSEGPFKPLHKMNPTRLAFIRSTLCRHFGKDPYSPKPFEGLKFVDVGCGGGILSEPLARMGATVMGIDAVDKNIKIARLHADLDPTTSSIDYRCTTAVKPPKCVYLQKVM
ncbi:unnamed protein product [Cuscuta campestris]|uniref:Methyltransferase type 11 domain-containing protein n=1 Tax=Cuscuta campestris TaxID=132261 RepID=A0A484LQ36_9ASTE|nr:unnamed protein product [Cuscuta campestris]VFQ78048.1 unnamed protein product [Cuscuta campestris]